MTSRPGGRGEGALPQCHLPGSDESRLPIGGAQGIWAWLRGQLTQGSRLLPCCQRTCTGEGGAAAGIVGD